MIQKKFLFEQIFSELVHKILGDIQKAFSKSQAIVNEAEMNSNFDQLYNLSFYFLIGTNKFSQS